MDSWPRWSQLGTMRAVLLSTMFVVAACGSVSEPRHQASEAAGSAGSLTAAGMGGLIDDAPIAGTGGSIVSAGAAGERSEAGAGGQAGTEDEPLTSGNGGQAGSAGAATAGAGTGGQAGTAGAPSTDPKPGELWGFCDGTAKPPLLCKDAANNCWPWILADKHVGLGICGPQCQSVQNGKIVVDYTLQKQCEALGGVCARISPDYQWACYPHYPG